MRILVVSDTHGRWGALYNVINSQPAAEIVIHLGDGNEDLERIRPEFPDKAMYGVAGNCDYFSPSGTRSCDTLTVGGRTVFYTHGHAYQVKSGETLVEQAAAARGADICLFGHTHIPMTTYRNGMYIMNPGSIGLPRDGAPTCGIIDITDAGIYAFIHKCRI